MPQCKTCGKTATSVCSRCDTEPYCSQECQQSGWKVHKSICSAAPEIGPVFRGGKWEELDAISYDRVMSASRKILRNADDYPPLAVYYALWGQQRRRTYMLMFQKRQAMARKKHLNPNVGWEEWLDILLLDFAELIPGLAYAEGGDDRDKLLYLRDTVVPNYLVISAQ